MSADPTSASEPSAVHRDLRVPGAAGATRLETFSDAVFAFALTLLVVSLEVPRGYDELMAAMSGFVAFALCLAMLVWLWYEHCRFFARYPLEDGLTVVVNACLLFVVLFYVYPLKFLFTWLSYVALGLGGSHPPRIESADQARQLMMVYAAGFVAVFVLFTLLHARALAAAPRLGWPASTRKALRQAACRHVATVAVGLLSLAAAFVLPARQAGIAGFIYCLLAPTHTLLGLWMRRRAAA